MKESDTTRKWLICAGCTLLLFISGGMVVNTFTVFIPYIIKEYGLTNSEAALITTIRCASSMLFTPLNEKYYRRLNAKRGTAVAVLLCVTSFTISAISRRKLGFYLAAVVAGAGYALGGMVAATIILDRWFATNKGKTMGIVSAGTAMAAIILPAPVTAIIEKFGISLAFFSEAIFALALGIVIFVLLSEEYPSDVPERKAEEHFTEKQMSGTEKLPGGYLPAVLTAMFFVGAIGSCSAANIAAHFTLFGYGSYIIASAISLYGFTLLAAKFLFGTLADRYTTSRISYIFFTPMILSTVMCVFAFEKSNVLLIVSQILMGIGYSMFTVGIPLWAEDFSLPGNHAVTVQRYQFLYYLGGLICSPLPGIIADITGEYTGAYVLFSAMGIAIAVIIWLTYRKIYITEENI